MTESVAADGGGGGGRSTPLRIDAQRNLEHVLRAAREVFGELGYGAPMEDVARRARVGVGTVYRRFPSKEVLVRRIAEEETARLTGQAHAALSQEHDPWSALARFLRTSVASGAGRLLPPRVLRAGSGSGASGTASEVRVPHQRQPGEGGGAPDLWLVADGAGSAPAGPVSPVGSAIPDASAPSGAVAEGERPASQEEPPEGEGVAELLAVVSRLVDRAREAGALRPDVTVADVLLVIATTAPSLPDAEQQAEASSRLLDILLEGLRSREKR